LFDQRIIGFRPRVTGIDRQGSLGIDIRAEKDCCCNQAEIRKKAICFFHVLQFNSYLG